MVVICVGFAMWGYFVYAFGYAGFHNIPSSVSTLVQLLLGLFDYDGLSAVRAHGPVVST